MKRNTFSFLFFFIILVFIGGCVRKSKNQLNRSKARLADKSYLYVRDGTPFGILRVECNDCQLIYIVNHKKYILDIKNGNEDRFIYPKPNTCVMTILKSHQDQMIRILAINPNGKMVSNVLDTFSKDEERKNRYLMQWIRLNHTVVVDILPKNNRTKS
jgi:hypothetical protein